MNLRRLLVLLFGRTRWSAVVLIIPICHFIAGCYFIRWGMTEPHHMAARGWEHLSEAGAVLCIVACFATFGVRLFVWLLAALWVVSIIACFGLVGSTGPNDPYRVIEMIVATGWAIFIGATIASLIRYEIWHWKETCRAHPMP